MSILLAVTLAAAVQPSCSWDNPGHNPYTGGAAAAIDRYTDIPSAVRGTLKRRIEEGQADDKVDITRDGIAGKNQYDPAIRDMHFGGASVCATVTRAKWAEQRVEPGAVYCVGEHCILVPRICGNISRITRLAPAVAAAAPAEQNRELEDAVEFADMALSDPDPKFEATRQEYLGDLDDETLMRMANSSTNALRDLLSARMRAAGLSDFELEQRTMMTAQEMADEYARRLAALHGPGVGAIGDGEVLAAVPEADTWAMLLGGLGLVGWVARRRKAGNAA